MNPEPMQPLVLEIGQTIQYRSGKRMRQGEIVGAPIVTRTNWKAHWSELAWKVRRPDEDKRRPSDPSVIFVQERRIMGVL